MKYCGIDAVASIVYPEAAAKRFKGQSFKSYSAIAKKLKPNETVTVEVRATSLGQLLGYGEVTGIKNGTYSVPRMLAHEY